MPALIAALCVAVSCAVVAALTITAPPADAKQPANPNAVLRIHPGGGPARFGASQTLTAEVSGPSGAGIAGVEIDFEVTEGPGDTDGNTPLTPDLTCETSGGDAHHPATCTVSYSEPLNQQGSDAVLAWIDADGLDSTVDADLGEGENENAPGTGGCAAGTKGPGNGSEPDATDCVEKRWIARAATTLDFAPRASTGSLDSVVNLSATVRDQFGDPVGALGVSPATVSFELLAGSAHDPGDGSDFSSPDLGTCVTSADGTCSLPFTATSAGTDLVCAYIAGASAACSATPDAAGPGAGAAVISRVWEAPAPPPANDQNTATPPSPPTAPTVDPGAQPTPAPTTPATPQTDPPAPTTPATPQTDPPAPPTERSKDRPSDATPDSTQPDNSPGPRPADPAPASQPIRPAPVVTSPASPARSAHRVRRSHHGVAHHRSHAGAVRAQAPHRRFAGSPSGSRRAAQPPAHARHGQTARSLDALTRAALTTAHKMSFPLALALLVLAFLVIQGRLDRRDPKLRLAPIDSQHDTIPFV